MLKYTVKRLAQSLVTILLIATIVFLLMRCLPTDYYFTEEQLMKFTEEQKYAALEAAGLTDPIGTQLIHFYNDLLHLDFGTSRRIQNGATVVKVIGKKFGVSMRLGLISAGISLVVGVLAVIIACIIGTAFGMIAGYFGGVVDDVINRISEAIRVIPQVVLAIALCAVFGGGILNMSIILGISNMTIYVRMMRGEVMSIKERDYIMAGKLQGNSSFRLMLKHVLPNSISPIIVTMTQQIGNTILSEAGLSFLGLGISQPTASWGSLVSGGVQAHTRDELARLRQAVLPDIPNTQLRGI